MLRSRASLALSIALHAIALAAIGRTTWDAREPADNPSPRPAIYWFEITRHVGDVTIASPVAIEPQPSAAEPPNRAIAAPRPKPPAPGDTRQTTEPEHDTPVAAPVDRSVDFSEARGRAAKEVLAEREQATSYRSFSFVGTIAEQAALDTEQRRERVERGLQPPLTAFDSPAKGRPRTAEKNGLGQSTRWLSDDCYQVSGTGNLFLDQLLPGFMNAPTFCTRKEPREDLFATVKPAYLMDRDELAEAQSMSQRLEELR